MKSFRLLIKLLYLVQLFVFDNISAQNISGVINKYTHVTAVTCSSITVASTLGFKAGDTVMIIEMKGAFADTIDNTNKFGYITSYNDVGNYELDIIKSIAGTTINLQSGLLRQYNPSTAMVQLVRVPYYKNATVTAKLTAAPWNGITGGVLALQVADTLTMKADMDVSGLGFRGGIYSIVSGSQQDTLYYYTYASGLSGVKGEGIVDSGKYFEAGRGSLGNAAGGGNGHNSGGGGGGNYGHGGGGGRQWAGYGGIFNGGIGGDTLTYANKLNRIFMGGGGGGPHQNNNQATNGSNGGGIICISANTIIGNGDSIKASGVDVTAVSGLDGAGGGGAGGAIVLNVSNYSTNLFLKARGGHGGMANCSFDCIGTGGGGGGGGIWISIPSLPANVFTFLKGGLPGLNIYSGDTCYMSRYGADTGKKGGVVNGLVLPESFPFKLMLPGACASTSAFVSGGGTPPYTYLWSPGGQTTDSVSGLAPGNYTVTVKDNCGADTTFNFSISSGFTSVGSSKNVTCTGDSDGIAFVKVIGGVGPFTYNWLPNGGTHDTATHLSAGTYTVTVTDASGCKSTDTIKIVQPTPLSLTAKAISASCGKSNGSAVAVVGGGTTPYTYSWSPSAQTSDTAKNLSAGIFSVTVTDSNGCSAVKALTIVGDSGISASINKVNEKCFGDSNGKATAVVTGGTSPFSYAWSGSGNTSATDSSLSVGTYTLFVTDKNNCVAIDTVTISQPTVLKANITSAVNELCNGGNNGSATSVGSGGTSPYKYSWSPSGSSGSTANNLTASLYTVTVTDTNGCSAKDTVTIHQPTPIRDSISAFTNVLCNGGSTGSATVGVKGGTVPYTYLWSNSQTNTKATGLSAGTYTVTIKDKNSCTSTATITITQPPVIKDSMVAREVKCNGGNTGSAWVITGGGTKPYTYSWLPSGSTKDTITSLTAGSYTVSITDSNGCKATNNITITQPAAISITMSATATACDTTNGSATATVSGGTSPYAYSWSPSGGSSTTANGLGTGSYTVVVTDAQGCTASSSITVPIAPSPSITMSSTATACDTTNGSATAIVSGGKSPYSYSWSPSGGSSLTANGLGTGAYTVVVTDAQGCTASSSITVTITPSPSLTMSSVPSKCDSNTGSASVSVSGGKSPYTYIWSPGGGTTSTVTKLSSGLYTVTVKDQNGCTATDTITVKKDSPPIVTITSGNICKGDSVTLFATGGGSYKWSTGATTSSIKVSPSVNTIYKVVVTNGCSDSANTTVLVDNPAIVVCCDTTISLGNSAYVSATGATGYVWEPQNTVACYTCPGTEVTPTATGQTTYMVTATDSNGCHSMGYVTIDVTCGEYSIPNVFTPNGDGKNDFFAIKALGEDSYSIAIYDRWGVEVYSSTDPNIYWDGKNKNGDMVSDGVYYYIIKSTCNTSEEHHGFVQVIR